MRNYLFLAALFVAPTLVLAQPAPLFQNEQNQTTYQLARRYGDFTVAIQAVYNELAARPENLDLKDSLATLYFQTRNYVPALSIAQEVLAQRPGDGRLLELAAICQQSLGQAKEALASYEGLYQRTQRVFHLYQVAVLQYQLTRLGECAATVRAIVAHPKSGEERVYVPVNQSQGQNILAKAAALNILGILQRDQKEYPAAKKSFEEALKLDAEFLLAKNNLAEVNKIISGK